MASPRTSNLAELAARQGRTETVTFIPEPEPEDLFCPLISVDDHALEPPTAFEGRVPAALADRAPRVEVDDSGMPWWRVDDRRLPLLFANGAAGRDLPEWKGASRCAYTDFRPSVSDPVARLHDMDLTGVWASLCFGSTVWGFAGSLFSKMRDPEVGLASLRAWNRWMLEEWCATDPSRFIPCQLPWLRDPDVAADEIRRNAELGFRAVSFSENPEGLGFASVYGSTWDPFFRACAETGTVVNLHVGSSGRITNPSSESPPEVIAALFPVSGIETVVDWIYARVPVRHPDLSIVLSESGVSWVPMVIERLRRAHRMVPASEVWAASDPHPVDLLHRNFYFASVEDPSAFRMLDVIDVDHVMVETDFPHMDSTWPGCQAMVRGELQGLPPAIIRKVCFENAARLYRHPPPPPELIAGVSRPMTELFSVTGKTALITGATSGLGRMIAEGFVGAGVKVYICARSAADCQTVAAELSDAGDCVAVAADISSEAGCRDLADRVAGVEDRVDILVNAAGGTWMAPIDSFDEQGWDVVLAVNVKGPFHLTRFLLPLLRAAASDDDPARVINIGSVSATRIPDMDNYSYPSTKAALHTLTRHLARRLAPAVTVNAIAPGPFPSRMMSDLLDRHGEQIAASAPMRRIGRPSDIAGAALYLASPAASWVTGTVLTVDGGLGTT